MMGFFALILAGGLHYLVNAKKQHTGVRRRFEMEIESFEKSGAMTNSAGR